MTIRALRSEAARRLAATSSTPALDADLLLAHVLGWQRSRLLAETTHTPAEAERGAFAHLLARREAGEPVAYLLGTRAFYGLTLQVDARVLVPRPETELLVERALALAHAPERRPPTTLADIGTGSGAIALALATCLPAAQIYATDISADALAVAASNAARLGLHERLTLLHGDGLAPLPAPVDMLLSNPPYTILDEIDANVRAYEPHLALDGGPDGLAAYRHLLGQVPGALRPGGALLLEIGAAQAADVIALVQAALPTAAVAVWPDLAGHARVVEAVLPPA